MSTITVPEPISSSPDIADRLQQLRSRIAGRLRLGLRNEGTRYGLRRDLAKPFPAPTAKIPISVRPLVEADLATLLAVDATTSPEDRYEIVCRRSLAAKRIAGAYVAVDERDGRPCYVQWLFGAADNDFIRQLGGFPQLAADEALLEGAYTPASHRGLGIMPAAMALIAEQAEKIGARYVITFVAPENIPSLKGCQRSGFFPDLLHRLVGLGFGLFRRDSFTKLAADDPRRTQKF
jgi:RimJ/RimL family protein N-acetyltransferase